MTAPSVRAALERLLASPGFDGSARHRRLLGYLVEETLAGRADRLKSLTIAIDVFGRDAATYDREADPVVRIEAAKLRRRLKSYYLTAGQEDPIRIDLPKGTYVPTFEERDHPSPAAATLRSPSPRAARPRWHWPATGLLAVLCLGALGWLGPNLLGPRLWSGGSQDDATALPRGPKIAVLPFLNLSGDPQQAYLAEGVTDQIVTDLARFKALFVLSMETTAKDQEQSADPQKLKRELGVDYLLDGSVRRERDQIRLSTRLVDADSGKIIWSESYRDELIPSNVFEIQEDVSQQVSAIVASNYGMIAEAGLAEAQRRPPKSFAAYVASFATIITRDCSTHRSTPRCAPVWSAPSSSIPIIRTRGRCLRTSTHKSIGSASIRDQSSTILLSVPLAQRIAQSRSSRGTRPPS
jgi:TolB-like protein